MPKIENPYAQATVENFRRTPASLRPLLLKMIERELNGSEADQTFPAASLRRIPFDDRSSDHHRRRSLAPNLAGLPGLLSQVSPASGIGEELADSSRDRSVGEGQGHRNPPSRRVASSLSTSRIMSAIRLALG